jgi:hypothetical protein
MNLLIALDRDGRAELFQQIERVARRWLYESLHGWPLAGFTGTPFDRVRHAVHSTLHDRSRPLLGAGLSVRGLCRYSETDVRNVTYRARGVDRPRALPGRPGWLKRL